MIKEWVMIKFLKKVGVAYIAFGFGTVFGAVVATTTSFLVFTALGGQLDAYDPMKLRECMVEQAP